MALRREWQVDDLPVSNDKGYCIPCGGTIDRGVGVEPSLTPGGSREVFYIDADTGAALWDVSYDAGCNVTAPRP